MTTKVRKLCNAPSDDEIIREAAGVLRGGGLVAFPTDTVYGLGGNPFDKEAISRIYRVKKRPSHNALILLISEMEMLDGLVTDISKEAHRLMEAYWPGAVTLVFNKAGKVPDFITAGLPTVGVRIPGHKTARSLIRAAGGILAAPSANISGHPSPVCAKDVLRDLDGKIEMVVDAGISDKGCGSTIIEVISNPPVIIRKGPIDAGHILQDTGVWCKYSDDGRRGNEHSGGDG